MTEQKESPADPIGLTVARVWGTNGKPAGAAFLVAPGLLLTAAHVVNLALGVDVNAESQPTTPVRVDFPLVTAGKRLRAVVEHWTPPLGSGPRDIAGLRLLETSDSPDLPAPLVGPREAFDLRAIAFGFPPRADNGVWSIVRLRGRQADGWVQVDHDEASQFAIQPGFSGAPVWDPQRGTVIGMITHAWSGRTIKSAYMLDARDLYRAWPGLRELAQPPSPYPGLRAFMEEDAGVFFGREDLADRIAKRTLHGPIVTVTGPSGVGKSSLLAAGVMPKIRARSDTALITVSPGHGSTPLRALALAFAHAIRAETGAGDSLRHAASIEVQLKKGQSLDVVTALLHNASKQRAVILVDQFEQTLTSSPESISDFGRVLRVLTAPGSRVCLVVGLRTDFISEVLRLPAIAFLASEERLAIVPEMSPSELREVAEGPMRRLQVADFEPGLLDRIITDIADQPGSLPLVQFTLAQLWDGQRGGLLRHEEYRRIGGVHKALTNHAELIWAGLDGPERLLAERLFAQLVHPVPGRDAYTRMPIALAGLEDSLRDIAGRLASARVVVIGVAETTFEETGTVVELAHEALISRWDRLKAIADRHRDFRQWQDGLRLRADRWSKHPDARRANFIYQLLFQPTPRRVHEIEAEFRLEAPPPPRVRLLSIGELREADRWLVKHRMEFSTRELRYIEASRTRQAVVWTRIGAVVAILALITGNIMANANDHASAVVSRELAAIADSLSSTDVYGQAQLALRAWQTFPTEEASDAVLRSFEVLHSVDKVLPDSSSTLRRTAASSESDEASMSDVAGSFISRGMSSISGDGQFIAAIGPESTADLWKIDGNKVEPVDLEGADDSSSMPNGSATVSADGRYAAYTGIVAPALLEDSIPNECSPPGSAEEGVTDIAMTGCLWVYESSSGRRVLTTPIGEVAQFPAIEALTIDPSGSVVAAILRVEGEWKLRRWELESGDRWDDLNLQIDTPDVTGLWLSDEGRAAVIRYEAADADYEKNPSQTLAYFSLSGPNPTLMVLAPYVTWGSVAVSGDGSRIVATPVETLESVPNEYRVWEISTGERVASISELPQVPDGWISTINFAQVSFDTTGQRMYAAALHMDPSTIPTEALTGFGELDGDTEDDLEAMQAWGDQWQDSMAELGNWKLWTWDTSSNELHEESIRFPTEWSFIQPLGTAQNPSFALLAPGAVGLVLTDEQTAYDQLSDPLPQFGEDTGVNQAVSHLCEILVVDDQSDSVEELIPDGAHSGSLC